ncbi:hypothetical protein [Bdellovibrio bacteriovorus]|uniref:hypothetical protein n=1 Tax=Bdellovibrio bacteriovorus TaxID=959 RepID=UPI0035A6A304
MLQFVREIPILIVIQGALSSRRGFLFHLAAGFTKEIDPLSGMSVNLMLVDEWLKDLKTDLEATLFESSSESVNHAFAEVMAVARLNLTEKAEKEGAQLASLRFREERGWSFSWSHEQSPEEMMFTYPHYIESLPKNEKFDLLRVNFEWHRVQGCEADYQHEGFLLLKKLAQKEASELQNSLPSLLQTKLPSGSSLQNIELEYLGANYKVAFK